MIDGVPARVWQEWWDESPSFFLPESLRARFDAQAQVFQEQLPQFWNERYAARNQELQSTLKELLAWLEEPDCELFLSKLDDELLFWYVLRVQATWIGTAALAPESLLPAHMPDFWNWVCTKFPPGWVAMVFPPRWTLAKLPKKPAIWCIPHPKGMDV